MVWWGKALATKPGDLSSVLRTSKGQKREPTLTSTSVCAHTNVKRNGLFLFFFRPKLFAMDVKVVDVHA